MGGEGFMGIICLCHIGISMSSALPMSFVVSLDELNGISASRQE